MAKYKHIETIAKLFLIPLSGTFIPLFTGLYQNLGYALLQTISYVVLPCILISFFIWEGNVKIMRRLRNKWYRRDRNVYTDFIRRIIIHIFFTFLTSVISLLLVMFAAGK